MSITKRLLSVILTVCMIVAMVPAVALSAAGEPSLTFDVTVEEGSTEVTVPVFANGTFGEEEIIKIYYDATIFSAPVCLSPDGDPLTEEDDFDMVPGGSSRNGFYITVTDYVGGDRDNTPVGSITFTVADGLAEGVYEFTDAKTDGNVVGTVTAAAPDYDGFTLVFSADKTEVTPGDTFTITYKLYNIPEQGFTQYQFYNLFNQRAFDFTAASVPATLGGLTNYGTVNMADYMLCGTVAPNVLPDSKLTIGQATFTVKDTAANGEYTVTQDLSKPYPFTSFAYNAPDGSQVELGAPNVVPAVITVSGSEASAYENFTLETKASATTVAPGDTFTVDYKLCAIPENGMGGWQFRYEYDADTFEITAAPSIPAVIENKVVYGTSNARGLICGTFQLANFYSDAVVATATFTVKDTAQDGDYEFGFNVDVEGDCFYWIDADGSATGTKGTMTNYDTPDEAAAVVTVTGGVAQTYTISFVDGETVLATGEYEAGATVTAPEAPAKAADAQYTYTFAGWSDGTTTYTEIPAAAANVTYTAVYTSTVNTYTITWSVNGVETTETYEYGATPSFKGSVAKPADAQYTYRFAGFDPEIVAVTGDATYTATYTTTEVTYTITWNVGGTPFTETYPYGATVTFPATDKAPDAAYTYYFAGWTTGGVTYWADGEGFVVDSGEVDEDGDPIYVPAEFPTVTGNASITAEYVLDPNVFAYGNGMENWSNQTQLLIGLYLNNGETDGNLVDDYTYVVTIDGTTYTWKASSCYNGGDWGIARIQPCLADPQWIPVKDQVYTVSVDVVNNGITVYTGSFDAFLNVDPIVPAAREAVGGKIQTGLYWYYDGAETLTIYGTEMPERLPFSYDAAPWAEVAGYIKTVKFEGFMTQISRETLAHMPAVETVYVPEGVTTLWNDCFAYAGTIKTVYLPSTLTTIKQGTVWGSSGVTNVYYTGTAEEWGQKVTSIGLYNDGLTGKLQFCTVTASGEGDGFTWKAYSNGTGIFVGSGATEMNGDKAWQNAGITDAYFFGFKSIQGGAFSWSNTIKTAWIAQGTEAINGDAFAYSSLEEITIPASAAIRQGVVFGAGSVTTVYYESYPSALTAAASASAYNDGIKDAANKFCMDDEPTWTTLSMGKYGSGFETNAGQTALMITLSDANVNIRELYNNKADYEWVVTVDGKQYTWEPVSNYAFSDNNLIFRFNPMLADDFLVIEEGKGYKVESIELIQNGEVVYKGTSTDTWVGSTPIYPAGGYKLNLEAYGTGFENWGSSGETELLTQLSHDSVSISNLYATKGNFVWEVTIDGTAYRFAPTSNYPFSATNNIIRFEPCVYTEFVPVKDQEYAVSVKLYDATGTNVLYYTDTVEGFKITVDPITHDEPLGPTVLTMGKYGTGMENWGGATQILVTLDGKAGDALDQVWANKGDYEWKITIDGVTYTWMPASMAWAGDDNLFVRFTPCLYETKLIPETNKGYKVTKLEIVKDGEVLYTAASNDTWTLVDVAPILAAPIQLNIGKWGDGMENWAGSPNGEQTQILPTLTSDVVNVESLFNNKGLYTWVITIDGTPYTYAPTTFYGGGLNITRFEPVVNSDFVPVKDQEYTVKVEIYNGETLNYYTEELGGFKLIVDPIVPAPEHVSEWVRIDENTAVYYDAEGKIDTNFSEDGMVYTVDGEPAGGWTTIDGKEYYFRTVEEPVTEKLTGPSYVYWVLYDFDEFGVCKGTYTGMVGHAYYEDGELFTGFKDGSFYYKGSIKTGWFDYEGETYYASVTSKKVLKGVTNIAGVYYDLDPETGASNGTYNGTIGNFTYVDGVKLSGWEEIDGNTYYYSTVSGQKLTGMQYVKGVLYEFTADGVCVDTAGYTGFYAWANGCGNFVNGVMA